ncbi:MAG: helix-turn-helix domain-containing protein [Planctomycetaceae bacterium]
MRNEHPLEVPSDELPAFASWLREHRSSAGLTRDDVALATGMSVNRISAYENGRISPTVASLELLAGVIGVALPWAIDAMRAV